MRPDDDEINFIQGHCQRRQGHLSDVGQAFKALTGSTRVVTNVPTLEKEIFMAACKRCGAETQLHSRGIPICVACSEALEAKTALTPDIPNEVHLGLPHDKFTDQ